MAELCYNIRKDVFGVLAETPRAGLDIWFLLLRIAPDGQGPLKLPRKLWKDARLLVERGIVIESAQGEFSINPEMFFMTEEPTIREIRDAAHS